MKKLRIIVGGYVGLFPAGGATWDYIQYPLGLMLLGHDVYYVEDTQMYPVYQKDTAWNDSSFTIAYVKNTMETFGMGERWAYRDLATNQCYGLSEKKVLEICSTADVFINISCSTFLREEYLRIPCRVLIDSDPMFTQIQYANESEGKADKSWTTKFMIENHNYLFSFGENIGNPDCLIPTFSFNWLTTRQPICLDLWENNIPGTAFTTIMNWSNRSKFIYDNQEWGQKDVEFEKFKSVPLHLPDVPFEVVINKPLNKESIYPIQELRDLGWKILEPETSVSNTHTYREFIQNSLGEFSIAKETYVKSNSGWFSCRSACYLASGKPVITQETGWSKFIPSGLGLLTFNNKEQAVEAVMRVNENKSKHRDKANQIAKEFFNSDIVLQELLDKLS